MPLRSKIISLQFVTTAKKVFRFFSSLKTAIPLLVITIAVTIAGSLLPTTDFFKSWWYLSLLGLNGVSLLFITILHTPMILERKGRKALIGVVATHLGILILIAGAIYGLSSGFRHEIRAIEDEMTVVIVEHELEWIGDFADRVIVMHEGRIVNDGDPRTVLADEALIEMGVGNTAYTTVARQAREAGLITHDGSLPVTLSQAVAFFDHR